MCISDSKLALLCSCPWMTMNVLRALIWGLQINVSEYANLPTWNQERGMRIDSSFVESQVVQIVKSDLCDCIPTLLLLLTCHYSLNLIILFPLNPDNSYFAEVL